jgi:hypothetical protein
MFGGRRRRGVPCLRIQDRDLVGEVAIRCTTHVCGDMVNELLEVGRPLRSDADLVFFDTGAVSVFLFEGYF